MLHTELTNSANKYPLEGTKATTTNDQHIRLELLYLTTNHIFWVSFSYPSLAIYPEFMAVIDKEFKQVEASNLLSLLHTLKIPRRCIDAIHVIKSIFVWDLYMEKKELKSRDIGADELGERPFEGGAAANGGVRVPFQRRLVHCHHDLRRIAVSVSLRHFYLDLSLYTELEVLERVGVLIRE